MWFKPGQRHSRPWALFQRGFHCLCWSAAEGFQRCVSACRAGGCAEVILPQGTYPRQQEKSWMGAHRCYLHRKGTAYRLGLLLMWL